MSVLGAGPPGQGESGTSLLEVQVASLEPHAKPDDRGGAELGGEGCPSRKMGLSSGDLLRLSPGSRGNLG